MQSKVRSMLEGALLSGLFIVLMFLTIYTPLGIISSMALSVPFTIYAARHGMKSSFLVVGVSVILTLIIGAWPSIFSALFAGAVGIVMGEMYFRGKKATIVFLGGSIASLIFLLVSVVVSYLIFKINPIASIQSMLSESMKMSETMMKQFGGSDPKQVEMIKEMIGNLSKLIPMLLIIGSVQVAIINHWLSRKVLHRLGMKVSSFPPFRDWKWPRSVMYYYLIVLAATMFLAMNQSTGSFQIILLNIKPILDLMMVIQGLSLVFYFSYVKGYGKGIPILAMVMVFLFPNFPFILLLGVLDLGMDLRNRITRA